MDKQDILDLLNSDDMVAVRNEEDSKLLVVGDAAKVLLDTEDDCDKLNLAGWESFEKRCSSLFESQILPNHMVDFDLIRSFDTDSYIIIDSVPVLNPVDLDMSNLNKTYAKYMVSAATPEATEVEIANLVSVVMYPVILKHDLLCKFFKDIRPEDMGEIVNALVDLRKNIKQAKHSSSSIHVAILATVVGVCGRTNKEPLDISKMGISWESFGLSPLEAILSEKFLTLLEMFHAPDNTKSLLETCVAFLNIEDKETNETQPFESYNDMMWKTANETQKD